MNKNLWLIWKDDITRRRYIVGELLYVDSKYIFKYINPECDAAKVCGFDGFPGFPDFGKVYESEDLFVNIGSRLPNVKREDYINILNKYDLDIHSSKLDILIATKGRLITDNFEFVMQFQKDKIEFDVAGTRHNKDILKYKDELRSNMNLILERDYDNLYDDYAVKIFCLLNNSKCFLGYVPRYYSKDIACLLEDKVKYSAMIKKINFNSMFFDDNIIASVKMIFN